MKKRTLTILLIIPFIISLLTFVSIQILDNQVASDILGIQWNYKENEGFQIDPDNGYELEAEPIIDPIELNDLKSIGVSRSLEDIHPPDGPPV